MLSSEKMVRRRAMMYLKRGGIRNASQLSYSTRLASPTTKLHDGQPFTATAWTFPFQRNSVRFASFGADADVISESPPPPPTAPSIILPNKPWFDQNRSLSARVADLVEAPRLHPGDLDSGEIVDLISQCCRLNSVEGMQLAQEILDRLLVEKRRWKAKDVVVEMPVSTIQTIMYGWALLCSSSNIARDRMNDLLTLVVDEAKHDTETRVEMAELQDSEEGTEVERQHDGTPSSEPTVQVFNTYLQGLSNAAKLSPQVALEAEATLYGMMGYHRSQGWHTKPNSRSYTHVITAFANSGLSDAGDRALGILRRMQEVHTVEKEQYMIDYGMPYDPLQPSTNRRKIVTADAVAYTATMSALVRSDAPAEKAERLLKEMLESEPGLIRLDAAAFTMIINAYGKLAGDSNASKDARKAAAKRAEAIYRSMNDYLRTDGKAGPSGDTESEGIQERSLDLIPAFNACLDAWSKSGAQEAAPRTEMLLRKLLDSGDVKPNVISFNSCLHAWSRSSKFYPYSAQKAELLLNLQRELSSSGCLDESAKPDFQSYAITILAHAYSDHPRKVFFARQVLETMISSMKISGIGSTRNAAAPFSAVLTAAARSPSGADQTLHERFDDGFNSTVNTETDPYSVALQTYNELKEDVHKIGAMPDHHVFGVLLRCILRHCPPQSVERDQMTKVVFEDACLAGQVSRLVVESMFQLDMGHLLQGDSAITNVTELPKFWWRNVPPAWRKLASFNDKRGRRGNEK
jgi:hypothetical protein